VAGCGKRGAPATASVEIGCRSGAATARRARTHLNLFEIALDERGRTPPRSTKRPKFDLRQKQAQTPVRE
jgi:hypothetical protein